MDVAETARFQTSLQLCKEIWHDLGVLFQIRPLNNKFNGEINCRKTAPALRSPVRNPLQQGPTRIEAVNFR